jgi:hypothetical protein
MFEELCDKPVCVEFTAPDQSSDGGALLLRAADEEMGLTESMARALRDPRQAGKVRHSFHQMTRERVIGIGCGYPDANDAARLGKDPVMLIVCERRGESLASQPTLSRFENALTSTDLLRMAHALTDTVIKHERRRRQGRATRITIDMDPTEDPTYGGQQGTFFNAFYDNWCYLPMVTTIQFNEEPEHHLVAPALRPGNAKASRGALAILKRLVAKLRAAFPKAKVYVRMDGGFAEPMVFHWLESHRLWYAVNMAKNAVLKRLSERWMPELRTQATQTGRTATTFGEDRYRAGKWSEERRVVIKAEVVALEGRDPRDNPRFIITNIPWKPKKLYGFYALRGDAENRIKELKDGLRFDLTSCTSFRANQFRELLVAASYVLCQEVRRAARGTVLERAQVATLRERLFKVAVTVRESVRRILLEAPKAYAWLAVWRTVAVRLGARLAVCGAAP